MLPLRVNSIAPLLLINLINITAPAERLGGTMSASPRVGTSSLDTCLETFSAPSLPPTHLAAARRSYAPSSRPFSREGSREKVGVKGFPYTVAEGNLQRSDSPSHRRLRHHGARWTLVRTGVIDLKHLGQSTRYDPEGGTAEEYGEEADEQLFVTFVSPLEAKKKNKTK